MYSSLARAYGVFLSFAVAFALLAFDFGAAALAFPLCLGLWLASHLIGNLLGQRFLLRSCKQTLLVWIEGRGTPFTLQVSSCSQGIFISNRLLRSHMHHMSQVEALPYATCSKGTGSTRVLAGTFCQPSGGRTGALLSITACISLHAQKSQHC